MGLLKLNSEIPKFTFNSLTPSIKTKITGGCPYPPVHADSPYLVQEDYLKGVVGKIMGLERALDAFPISLLTSLVQPLTPAPPPTQQASIIPTPTFSPPPPPPASSPLPPNRIPTPPPPPPSWPYLAQQCSGAPPRPIKPFRLRAIQLKHVSPVQKKRTRDTFEDLIKNGIKKFRSYSDDEEQQSSSSW
ncbi:hypothetical protein BC833DRAFT_657521 [Globomyces pollinis-pini]|nr:hypothetical protein BC833DRAFT_657521 [Globomyces pollinis-pini]